MIELAGLLILLFIVMGAGYLFIEFWNYVTSLTIKDCPYCHTRTIETIRWGGRVPLSPWQLTFVQTGICVDCFRKHGRYAYKKEEHNHGK